MKLLFKQRAFSWFDSYDIYDEEGYTVFTVKGRISWGHKLEIHDARGLHIGTVQERILSFMPKFEMYADGQYIGQINKELTLLKPVFSLDMNGWIVKGDWLGWEYEVVTPDRQPVMTASRKLLQLTDTYIIDVVKPEDTLLSLMIVLAIDAAKCQSS